MPSARKILRRLAYVFALALAALPAAVALAGGRPLELTDLMKFHTLHDAVLSKDGHWIAYTLKVDRGDGEAVARSTRDETEHRIERGASPQISADGRWVAAKIEPTLEEREKDGQGKDKDEEDKPKTGLALLDLRDGAEVRIERVESFAFSEDGRFIAYKLFAEEEEKDKDETEEETEADEPLEKKEKAEDDDKDKDKKKDLGTKLVLRELESGDEIHLEHVTEYAFDEASTAFAYAVSAPQGEGNGAYLRHLGQDGTEETLAHLEKGRYTHLVWAKEVSRLAFLEAAVEDDEPGDARLHTWDQGGARSVASRDDAPEGWTIPSKNDLAWSRDGERLFFGFKPVEDEEDQEDEDEEPFDPYDVEAILEKREVDVWHWNDPLIVPNQKKQWKQEKDRTYRAVYHRGSGEVTALADLEMRQILTSENSRSALGLADTPYLKEVTWDGRYSDLYVVDLVSGERQLVRERLRRGRGGRSLSLSPGGRFVVFYQAGDWHLFDADDATTRNLTGSLGVPFANEDHDYPQPAPGYGLAEWVADESAVVIYDKYDAWQFRLDGSGPLRLTAGREEELVFRLIDLDPEEDVLKPGARLLLRGYHDKEKHDAFYAAELGRSGTEKLYGDGGHRLNFLAKAEDAERILFTRESYNEFPDLWISGPDVKEPRKLSTVNPQITDFAWGSPELVEWSSADGIPLQGILIKPGNYEPGKRYPVLVYFYRFFSQRLHQFNEPVVNHRPSFPLYASNGYAVFLPDIRFEIGRPGFSATKCLVPGVQKLIDIGIADPDAIGLHGHSWSGYQTAFVITQTNIFKAAIAGAPVSNMTSAYSGIRWETGLARQFQYERSQSRLGGSLWEVPERYIENSPVFFADRIETPLLTMFGDEDGAVPWYQGIELYLAMRRLGKDVIFLQYRGEGHHPKKYANKLDYSIKMKEYLDHHLKGEPAPEWMTEGVPYRGE